MRSAIRDLGSEYRIRLIDLLSVQGCYHFGESLTKFFPIVSLDHFKKETRQKMANRKGVFIGAYVPNHLKESLKRRAAAEHRTLSQEITRILEEAVHGKGLPVGSIDRRSKESIPRRRSTDPAPRRRTVDVLYAEGDPEGGSEKE
jgi:hypothetical protein